ncbi:glycosyltransferase family 32 protein [Mycena rebaudengoi]|nr:glycosyltransferase family 32 protein [Mycena rebaudengoi]
MASFKRTLIAAVLFLASLYFLANIQTRLTTDALPHGDSDEYYGTHDNPEPELFAQNSVQGHAETVAGAVVLPHDSEVLLEDTPKPPVSESPPIASLEDLLARQFPYDIDAEFPPSIWQTYKTALSSTSSWSVMNPGFAHEVVTDEDAITLIHRLYASAPLVLDAYDALPLSILKADFFRYLILLARGGIYSDIDTSPLKSINHWLPRANVSESGTRKFGLVIGIEGDVGSKENWQEWFPRRLQFCQWTIQAKAGHPVLRAVVKTITEAVLRQKAVWSARMGEGVFKFSTHDVLELTGPAVWTDVIFDYFNNAKYFDLSRGNLSWVDFTSMEVAKTIGDTVVLPITSFSPLADNQGARGVEDPMAFVMHMFAGSWRADELLRVGA